MNRTAEQPPTKERHLLRNTLALFAVAGLAAGAAYKTDTFTIVRDANGSFAGISLDDCDRREVQPLAHTDYEAITAALKKLGTGACSWCADSIQLTDEATGTVFRPCLDEESLTIDFSQGGMPRISARYRLNKPNESDPGFLFRALEQAKERCPAIKQELSDELSDDLARINPIFAGAEIIFLRVADDVNHPCNDQLIG